MPAGEILSLLMRLFNPHANGSAAIKMVKNMAADGARQNARMAGRRKDVGTHIPPTPDPK
jgi:hypothetical protein